MEGLRPDRDELDRFKHRNTKSGGKGAAKAPVSSPAAKPAQTDKSGRGVGVLVVLLIAVAGFLGFGLWQQQESLAQLRKQINSTEGFVGQSKLLMARLEGELNQTGAEIEQSGSAVDKKLAFLDSEMRKLWGVSNDRNRKAIQDNDAAIAGMEELLAKMQASQKQLSASVAGLQKSIDKQLAGLETQLSGIDKRVSLVASEAAITREGMTEEIAQLRASVQGLDELKAASAEYAKVIDSINASRSQLNDRVVKLERQVNQLSLQTPGAPQGPVVQ